MVVLTTMSSVVPEGPPQAPARPGVVLKATPGRGLTALALSGRQLPAASASSRGDVVAPATTSPRGIYDLAQARPWRALFRARQGRAWPVGGWPVHPNGQNARLRSVQPHRNWPFVLFQTGQNDQYPFCPFRPKWPTEISPADKSRQNGHLGHDHFWRLLPPKTTLVGRFRSKAKNDRPSKWLFLVAIQKLHFCARLPNRTSKADFAGPHAVKAR